MSRKSKFLKSILKKKINLPKIKKSQVIELNVDKGSSLNFYKNLIS